MARWALVLCAAWVAACGSDEIPSGAVDAATLDSGLVDTGPASDTAADGSAPTTPCWPFDAPPLPTLRAAKKKVFAHYFSQFPLSIDNQPPASDYYATQYLQPGGEGGKFAFCGGFLRERPKPVEPAAAGVDFLGRNFEIEVRRARALGIDGFAYDILSRSGTHWTRLAALADAAQRVDPGFHIVLMPDMYAAFSVDDAAAHGEFVAMVQAMAAHPSIHHLDDGRLVVAPYGVELRSPSWWASVVAELEKGGTKVAFVALYSGKPWETETPKLTAAMPVYATSTWGPRTVVGAEGMLGAAKKAHDLGVLFMAPVAPQDSRPKDLIFTEADNSAAYRALWKSAIEGGADWVQLITWNDYSEDSEMAPSSKTRGGFYDVAAYYTAWFKTGTPPPIARDTIYYYHRSHSMALPPDLTKQKAAFKAVNGSTASDNVEMLAFLTAPSTLSIELGGKVTTKDVPAGVQSFVVPLAVGTPKFRVLRAGAVVVETTSESPIVGSIVYQDPLYHAGGSRTCVGE